VDSNKFRETLRLAAETDERLEAMLDQALEATFPASDPVSVTFQPTENKS
jgi:hypothetical protein